MSRSAIIFVFVAIARVSAESLNDKIYHSINVDAVSRLLNKDGQIGSQSDESGSVGYLYRISAASDFDGFKTASGEHYIALMSQAMMANTASVKTLLGDGKLKGIMVYDESPRVSWSAGDKSPDGTTAEWNPSGGGFGEGNRVGMHWIDIGVPVFLLNNEDSTYVNTRFEQSRNFGSPNDVGPNMLSARLEFFMWAAGDASTCLRRLHSGFPFCQPLGGHSVMGALSPGATQKPSTIISAQLDAVSLFHDNSYGANAQAGAIAAIIALAKMIAEPLTAAQRDAAGRNIFFMLFEGEQFDNIGSSNWFLDWTQGRFPDGGNSLPLSNVDKYIELSHFGRGAGTTFVHSVGASTLATNIVAENGTVFSASSSSELPPSSYNFLKTLGNPFDGNQIDGVVLADFDSAFQNSYFHTRLDDAENININASSDTDAQAVVNICNAMSNLASVLRADTGLPATQAVDEDTKCRTLVLGLLKMMLVNGRETVVGSGYNITMNYNEDEPINRYVSVYTPRKGKNAEGLAYVHLSAALNVGDTVRTADECQDSDGESPLTYHKVIQGDHCFNTTTFWWEALSPAINGNQNGLTGWKDTMSTWTESTWDDPSASVFLMADPQEEHAVLGGGIAYAIVVTVVVYFLNKKAAVTARS